MNDAANAPKLVIYWLLVGIPLAWGVYHTLIAAGKLFGL
ncbi:MFS transporter small subunit [Acidiphilium iwatense]